jgi:HTH-type transcriptional regulator / antitoxin HigA
MTTTISRKHYIELLNQDRIIPKIIETQEEYDHFLAITERLISKKQTRTSEETILFRLLVKLIRDYEEETYSLQECPLYSGKVIVRQVQHRNSLLITTCLGVHANYMRSFLNITATCTSLYTMVSMRCQPMCRYKPPSKASV